VLVGYSKISSGMRLVVGRVPAVPWGILRHVYRHAGVPIASAQTSRLRARIPVRLPPNPRQCP
jgi:hypothetical protein